jgi:hypothetical protein
MKKALLKQQGLSIELSSGKTTAEPCGSNPYVVCAGRGDDLKRDLALILLLFVSGDDLKQDLPGITLLFVKAQKKVVNLGKL